MSIITQVEGVFADGLEAGLAVVEEGAVSGGQNHQGTLLRLLPAALDLRLHVPAALGAYRL